MVIPGLVGIDQLIKIFLALILGVIIGLERQSEQKPAGLRTYALVCVGATLITIISTEYFAADMARIAAGIITGIGFLGAGAIIAGQDTVHGLTTAAGLWVMAAVGLAVGVGAYLLGTIVTTIVLLILIFGKMEKEIIQKRAKR